MKMRHNGKAVDPLIERATKLARVDYEINGRFDNAPYVIIDDNGVIHKAYIRSASEQGGERVMIEIIRPAATVTTGILWNRPDDVLDREPPDTIFNAPGE